MGNLSNRIQWVDGMRGFSMILVVLGHVLMCMGLGGEKTFLSSLMMSFRMPLFFFVSGYFSFRLSSWWNKNRVIDIVKRKFTAQIIGASLFLFVFQFSISGHITIESGFGYFWFTYVLFQMYLIFLLCSLFQKMTHFNICFPILGIIAVVGIFLAIYPPASPVFTKFSYDNLAHYFQFYVMGLLCAKYQSRFFSLLQKDNFVTIVIIGWIVCVLLWHSTFLEQRMFQVYYIIRYILTKYFALFTVIILFFNQKDYFTTDAPWSKKLKFIGQRTLDIYLIHFFFLPNLKFLGKYLIGGDLFSIQLLASAILTAVIVILSILVSNVLRSSKTLECFLFGVRKK